MVFGGVLTERLQLNEKTLWSGGPGAVEDGNAYHYGLWPSPRPDAIPRLRERLAREGSLEPAAMVEALGLRDYAFGAYQPFGDLYLDVHPDPTEVSGYWRDLDIGQAVASVGYRFDEVSYSREYFVSHPAQVAVYRLTADREAKVSFTARFAAPHDGCSVTAAGGLITIRGALPDNGLIYEGQIQILAEEGLIVDRPDGSVSVVDANAATILFAAGTNYAASYPDYRGADPHVEVSQRIDLAGATPYAELRAAHVADHEELFDRVRLDLGQRARPHMMPTDVQLANYDGTGPFDRALEALYFQYGRYLLIASSRVGSLPANLQGVWNASKTPPWCSDYHVNINLQMNYWPAEITNLAETTPPLFEFIDAMRTPGRVAAKQLYGARGWVVGNQTNVWGYNGHRDHPTSFWYPEAAGWLCRHLWEHYEFSGDIGFLRDTAYPILADTALFWLDFLVEDPADGTLVVSPSFSPEQGLVTVGASMGQQIVCDLFTTTLAAGERLGTETQLHKDLRHALDRLDSGLRVGSWGQLQEWKPDLDDPANQHRHTSHLYALHPSGQISPRSAPELTEAAKVTLKARGDGGTGWSKAWKINFWARLLDGDHAHLMLSEQLIHSTLPNLWDTHPPFQIDGNFGATSGVAEMLLQSHDGAIDVLPALPSAWPEGAVEGLRARGGVEVDITWQGGRATQIVVRPSRDGSLRIRTGHDEELTFEAVAGQQYVIARSADEQLDLRH
ncbi:glycoside hydrolase family 95 protein [Flindersiella endophytica]